ncbi:MAG: hypothetical protein ACOYXT_07165 [Bacteroidota bacterium]
MQAFKRTIAAVGLAIIIAHVALGLYTAFFHSAQPTTLTSVYNRWFLLGPFFSESRFKASHHVSVRYYHAGKWSAFDDYGKKNFDYYRGHPWRYDKLKLCSYERAIMRNTVRKLKPVTKGVVSYDDRIQQANRYVADHIPIDLPDSIHLVYKLYWFTPQDQTYQIDTVFNIRYAPTDEQL